MSKRIMLSVWLSTCAITWSFAGADILDVPSVTYPTIQSAINAANNGDEVVVASGTYNEIINFNGKTITVRSTDGSEVTTIDGTGFADSVVKCVSGEGLGTVLQGFTVTGGTGNTSLGLPVGGGMFNLLSSPTVQRCVFRSNQVGLGAGGGMYNLNASPMVSNCLFVLNTAEEGAAIRGFHSDAVITNCTLFGNIANVGGGIFTSESNPTIANCIIWGNSDSNTNIESSQIHVASGTATVTYCLIEELDAFGGGAGTIGGNPKFINAVAGNMRLDEGSPCIDAGNNAESLSDMDLDGLARRVDDGLAPDTGSGTPPIVDMGAYEAAGDCNDNGIPDDTEPDSDGDNVIDGCDVCPDSPPGSPVGRTGCPLVHNVTQNALFDTIQDAIDASVDGDEIVVLPARYRETIDLAGRAITLRSSDGPDVTIIDATDLGDSAIFCGNDEGLDTIIRGFTLTGGPVPQGGGMRNEASSPTVIDCRFVDGVAVFGGGLYNTGNGSPRLVNCMFVGNEASTAGGGMANVSAHPFLINCVFSGNDGVWGGGGMYNRFASPPMTGCTFYGNTTSLFGGGILSDDSHETITNSIFWQNVDSTGIESSGQIRVLVGEPVVEFSCIQGGWFGAGGTGNITMDPWFADPAAGDFRLSAGSPCIDAGSNFAFILAVVSIGVLVDGNGVPRFIDDPATPDVGLGLGPIIDMGAYEFSFAPADFDVSGQVDLFDFSRFLEMFTGPSDP